MFKLRVLAFLVVFSAVGAYAQSIMNAYAQVTLVTSSTLLAVTNVNETSHTFSVGQQVIVMQMQDNVIGTNTTNATTFGNLGSIANAGNFEVRTVTVVNRSAGTATSIGLSQALSNTYNTGANSRVQVITFRLLSATSYTTTGSITGLAWNGNVGGVIALNVGADLVLSHSITADGLGFRGGTVSTNYYGGTTTCSTLTPVSTFTRVGGKGEGIYAVTSATQAAGTAKVLNGGGGGGQDINGGGGGGGNYTAGGLGGNGWNGTAGGCSPSAAGAGGITLSVSISGSRVFMGGGGGGGQQNDGVGSSGARGGGIILIKAGRIVTGGCAFNPTITANGLASSTVANDGAGGGGAGGSIVLSVPVFSVSAGCPLTIRTNGGNGGNVTDAQNHAGGGAGGQGVVVYSIPQPTTNITTITNNGTPGCNNSGCTNSAGAAGGTNSVGIVVNATGVLPIELLAFNANARNNRVDLDWTTASEKNTDYFLVERSTDALNWQSIEKVPANGTTKVAHSYTGTDYNPPAGLVYYRLISVDYDRSEQYSPMYAINFQATLPDMVLYPNPASGQLTIAFSANATLPDISLYDATGRTFAVNVLESLDSKLILDISSLKAGLYYLVARLNGDLKTAKLIVE